MNSHNKKFYIKTLGCKVNQYESQAMREALEASGMEEADSARGADICILNTCTVTENADKESRYFINLFHRANPGAKIAVTGCYAEKDAGDISSLPGVSGIIKNSDKPRIAKIIANCKLQITNSQRITGFKDHTKAFVKIQDGCKNFCSYCKVPFVRPVLSSKPLVDIVEEVRGLVANGFKEIVLTGICLGAWGEDVSSNAGLIDALEALNCVDGDFRIRLSSIEPKYVTDGLLNFMASNERICRHLHIPLQSGDDAILKKMNRPYTALDYRLLVEKARAKMPGVAITTDVLVGFPGESEANFANTLNFIKEILPSRVHIFTYSGRPGTVAYSMAGAVPENVLKERYYRLKVVALGASYIYRNHFMNGRLNVLVEGKRDARSGLVKGYSDNYINILFDGPDTIMSRIVPVRVDGLTLEHTFGVYEQ